LKAANDVTDKGIDELLTLIKKMFLEGNLLRK
jgi:hypothetical protein